MIPYPRQRERIFTSLSGFEAVLPKIVRRRRKTVCAGKKYPFKWLRINPCIELPDIGPGDVPTISASREASYIFHESVDFSGRGVEYAMIMCLDVKNKPNAIAVVGQGGRASAIIDPSVIFQAVILSNSSGFILAHNHPSEVADPSNEDVAYTTRLAQGARLLGVQMLDSLVLTSNRDVYFSMLDAGMMPTER